MKGREYKFLFKKYSNQYSERLDFKNIYGNIFFEHLRLNIKSETEYYSIRLKVHLVKITNPGVGVERLIKKTFHLKSDKDFDFKVPRDR